MPHDASAEQIADAIVAIWADIDLALNPVIGPRGVAALYNRSLGVTAVVHPWLPLHPAGLLAPVDMPALKAALLQQPPAAGAAGSAALFLAFHTLLSSLVGTSLTDRLLVSVWAPSPGASPAQDIVT